MQKRLTLKIACLLFMIMTVLQFVPVYAEGSVNQTQATTTEQTTVNPYHISVQEVLCVHPLLANKLTYKEQDLLVPDVMNAKTIINQVKARRTILAEKEQANMLTSRQAQSVEVSAAQSTSQTAQNSARSQAKKKATSSSTIASSASRNTVTVAGRAYTYKKVLQMRATAYTADPSENGTWGAVDALGNALKLGTVAVDPNVIPLGTKLFITGYQFEHLPNGGYLATASDTGGAIKGNKIDLFIPVSKETGNSFGNQNIKVYVLK